MYGQYAVLRTQTRHHCSPDHVIEVASGYLTTK
jgi:hypothetical protein